MTHERRVIHLAVVLHDLCQCTEVSSVHVRSGVHQVPQTRSLEGTELLRALNQVTELLLGAGDVIAVLTPAVEWVAQLLKFGSLVYCIAQEGSSVEAVVAVVER